MANIILNGICADNYGLTLGSISLFIFPRRERKTEAILGSLAAAEETEWSYSPTPIPFTLLTKGAGRDAVVQNFRDAAAWLLNAVDLRLTTDLSRYYIGSIQNVGDVDMQSRTTGSIKADFVCNPPCWHRVLSPVEDFMLSFDVRPPEQITAGNCTVSGTFTTAGSLPSMTYTAGHPAALYFAIVGQFTSLTIGGSDGLVINWPTPQSMTVYIDCEEERVYHLLGGVITNIPYSGNFPRLTNTSQIAIGGTSLDVTVRMLVVERG